jgi:glycosyltransferase involved in cell wall biosynthesis
MQISVITVTYRGIERLQTQADALAAQTFRDFEWVIVDDHYAWHKETVAGFQIEVPIVHIPPREVKPHQAWSSAMNTALLHANGELLYFMADSIILADPKVLERFAYIYAKYGPDVLISGRVDGYEPRANQVVPYQQRPKGTEVESGIEVQEDPDALGHWYWASKNDAAPLQMALAVNGCDERFDGHLGGMDVVFAARMWAKGCKWYIVRDAMVVDAYDHVGSKPNQGDLPGWEDMFWKAIEGEPSSNEFSLEEMRLCVSS